MNIYAATKKGNNKTESEDRIIIGKSIITSGCYSTCLYNGVVAIADGVGGNNAGAVASQFVASKLCELTEFTIESISLINNQLINLSKSNPNYYGMATTLSGVFISSNETSLFSIGNTRVYSLQNRKYLKQLTSDDTTLNYLLASGQLNKNEAERFDRKNEITACFGGDTCELFKVKISNCVTLQMPLLMTSDGVHDYVSVDKMEEIIEEYGISLAACNVMISVAIANGSRDDASILLGDK